MVSKSSKKPNPQESHYGRELGVRGSPQRRFELVPDPSAPMTGRSTPASTTGRSTPASTTGRNTPASSYGGARMTSSNDSGGSVHGTTSIRSPRPGLMDQEISSSCSAPLRATGLSTPTSTLDLNRAALVEAQRQRFGTDYIARGCLGIGHVLERSLQCPDPNCACKKSCGDLRCQLCGPIIRSAWSEATCLAELERVGLQIKWNENKAGREISKSRDLTRGGRRRDGLGIPRTRRGYFGLDSVHLLEDPAAGPHQNPQTPFHRSSADSSQFNVRMQSPEGSVMSVDDLSLEKLNISDPKTRQ